MEFASLKLAAADCCDLSLNCLCLCGQMSRSDAFAFARRSGASSNSSTVRTGRPEQPRVTCLCCVLLTAVQFQFPNPADVADLCTAANGDIYLASFASILKVTIATGKVELFAGHPTEQGETDGLGTAARFNCNVGIAIDGTSSRLFVCDFQCDSVRQIAVPSGAYTCLLACALLTRSRFVHCTGVVTTVLARGHAAAGAGSAAFRHLAFDAKRNGLFMTESNHLRFISLATGQSACVVSMVLTGGVLGRCCYECRGGPQRGRCRRGGPCGPIQLSADPLRRSRHRRSARMRFW
jgi:hypothetical protein